MGYLRNGEWSQTVLFDFPIDNGTILLHTDAPERLILSLRIVLRMRPRIANRVTVFTE